MTPSWSVRSASLGVIPRVRAAPARAPVARVRRVWVSTWAGTSAGGAGSTAAAATLHRFRHRRRKRRSRLFVGPLIGRQVVPGIRACVGIGISCDRLIRRSGHAFAGAPLPRRPRLSSAPPPGAFGRLTLGRGLGVSRRRRYGGRGLVRSGRARGCVGDARTLPGCGRGDACVASMLRTRRSLKSTFALSDSICDERLCSSRLTLDTSVTMRCRSS